MKKNVLKGLSDIFEFLTPVRVLIFIGVSLFFWWFILGDQGVYQVRDLMNMNKNLTQDRKDLNDEIDQLKREREILLNPEDIEMVIRSELGYIKPGEVVFEEKK